MVEDKTKHSMENSQAWAPAKPEKLPRLTFWPIALAAGVVFFSWGLITSVIVSIVGLAVTATALYGWIGEFSDE